MMETSEEELLENVTDESGNSYMIQRMTVDNGQLLSTEILQTPAGLVVDLGGDFIPVNYTSEDLLSHDITDEDRNLAAALVAVQFSQQQKQQQTQQDGSVIVNTSLPSLLTTLDGKVQLGEQQVLLQDKQTGFLQIVDAEDLYKQDFAKFDENTQQLQLIKTEEIVEPDSCEQAPPVKKILPHKKRIPRKLKKNEKTMITNLQKCSFCSQYINLNEFHSHQVLCQSNIASIPANQFACQICSTSFADQLEFFEHLKKHYEPTEIVSEKADVEQHDEIQPIEMELVQGGEQQLADHITILKADDEILQNHQGTIIKIEGTNDDQKESFLNSILQLTCLQCNRAFRRQKFYEAHMREVHGSKELNEFSETEDLMAGINGVAEIESDTKEWYRDEELHATEEDLKELEAKEHVCQNCNQQFLARGALIDHMITCTNLDEEEEGVQEIEDMPVVNVKPVKAKGDVTKKAVKRGTKSKMELECDLCDRKFQHRNSLVYHLRSHTEDRPYQCHQCGKSFFAASALKVHLRLHSGEKPYRCEFCGRHFRQWGDLKYHCISLHSDEKQYQCEYCGKEFARKYSLIVHRRIHTGEKNYRCEFCGKTFRASSYLQNHRRIHTGEKPHACEVCGKRFRVRSDMKRHLRTHTKNGRASRIVVSEESQMAVVDEEMKIDVIEHVLTHESEDTSESMTLLKEEENVSAVQGLQYEQDGALESIRDNTLYVHMPILIT